MIQTRQTTRKYGNRHGKVDNLFMLPYGASHFEGFFKMSWVKDRSPTKFDIYINNVYGVVSKVDINSIWLSYVDQLTMTYE